jgi:hypothetical protein
MSEPLAAFNNPIKDGLVRILLTIQAIETEVENDAPDFTHPKEDSPMLKLSPDTDVSSITEAFQKSYPLVLAPHSSEEGTLFWELKDKGIWFDIAMEQVKDIWLADFNFYIESKMPRYLAYYIQNLEHKIEWLQKDEKSGEIRSLSNFKKKFKRPSISERESYSGADVMKCSDMLGRAFRKIDIRTNSAMVKFNTDKGRLEPLLIGMADRLGYQVKSLDKETIAKEDAAGNSVSHTVSLK